MKTMWRIYLNEVEPIEVEKETAKFIWISGRRREKGSWAADIYPTREVAVAEILRRAEVAVECSAEILEQSRKRLQNLRALYLSAEAKDEGTAEELSLPPNYGA